MIQSMTGYSRAMRPTPFGAVTVEIRSTNHRYLEVTQRLPNGLAELEGSVTELVKRHIQRGRVDVTVTVHAERAPAKRVVLDEALARDYVGRLLALKGRLGMKGRVTLEQVLTLPQVVGVTDDPRAHQRMVPPIRETVQTAVRQLLAMRRLEGRRLVRDLQAQVRLIQQRVVAIRRRLPKSQAQQHQRLRGRLTQLMGDNATVTTGQIQEALALLKEVDIHEELVRLESHGAHLRQLLGDQGPVGKKLDFIAQELTREVNTIGAKANDAVIARDVVEMKEAIEKIREQAQNLE